MLGWDPLRLALLRARANDVATSLRSLSDTVASLHGVEPFLAETDVVLRRVSSEWEHDLLPQVYRVLGSTFADHAVRVIDEWRLGAPMAAGLDHLANPADALFRSMLEQGDDPSAAAAFVLRAADDPSLLFDTAADPLLAQAVARRGTAALSAADAEHVLERFIEWFDHYELTHNPIDESYQQDWRPFLVDLVTPWTIYFAPLHTGWHLGPERRAELLAMVVGDIESLETFLFRSGGIVNELTDALAHGASGIALVEVVGSYLGLLGGLAIRVRTETEEARLAVWRRLWMVASLAVGALVGAFTGGTTTSAAADASVTAAQRATEPFRPNPERVAADTEYAHRASLLVAADSLVAAVVQQWQVDGVVTVDLAPVPRPDHDATDPITDYVRDLAAWRTDLPGGADGELALRLTAIVSAVLNPEEAGRSLADTTG